MLDRLFVRSRARVAMLALLLPAAAAFAQGTEADHLKNLLDHAKERFAAADTDHDGMLTKLEAQKGMPFVAKHFDEIDKAKAGKVSAADVTKFIEERRAKLTAEAKAETRPDK